jgi:exosortase/archaeosortase family protein
MNSLPLAAKLSAAALLAAAAGVWYRDHAWLAEAADTLPLAAGIPLALWLGRPWTPASHSPAGKQVPRVLLFSGLVAFLLGWILPSISLLALAWTLLAWCWTRHWLRPRRGSFGIFLILLLSFPWLPLEWPAIGWWFRLSAAAACEQFFHLLAIPVERQGTDLRVMGSSIHIEAACAGWNLLQLTLMAGTAIATFELSRQRRLVWFLLALPFLAWAANFLRVLALTALSLSFDVATAEGTLHGLTGLLVLAAVLLLAKATCLILESSPASPRIIVKS